VPEKPGWKLTFHDEFDGSKLDENKWFTAYRSGRIQYYKAKNIPGKPHAVPQSHYVIEKSVLHLRIGAELPVRGFYEPGEGAVSSIQTSDYTYDETHDKFHVQNRFSQKYGWFEIRCRMPAGSGLCSAFWLLQTDPAHQEYTIEGERKVRMEGREVVEIDIFEQLGKNPRMTTWCVHLLPGKGGEPTLDFDCSEDFHVYALDWTEGELVWHIDGKEVWKYSGETPRLEMGIFLSLYLASERGGWTGKPEKNMPFPRDFEIDYIRVYAHQTKAT
jgi:hypothetical protein